MSIMGILEEHDRKRREHNLCGPNMIWFQRHKNKPNIFAEVTLVSNRYRWRAFYKSWGKHCAEGRGKTLPKVMEQVFRFFERH